MSDACTPPLACASFALNHELPSPCFIIDEDALRYNASVLDKVQTLTGARILLALKAYAAWKTFPVLSRSQDGPLWGVCASSVDEAILGREKFGGIVSAFAAAWSEDEVGDLTLVADHVIFNSLQQLHKFKPLIEQANRTWRKNSPIEAGVRINPEHSEGSIAIYNPCSPFSRLGVRKKNFPDNAARELDGIHFHTLCEQDADALARTLNAVKAKFGGILKNKKWLNFGGGHHITRKDYNLDMLCQCLCEWKNEYKAQIYLEPGEAVAFKAGWLLATVLDIVNADMPIAILDISACCHTPDVLEMPYRPDVYYAGKNGNCLAAGLEGAFQYRLGGKSCLAGDDFGIYAFEQPLLPGQKLLFADMAIYSMVKTNTFNGLRLPAIGLYSSHCNPPFKLLKTFGYNDFYERLS